MPREMVITKGSSQSSKKRNLSAAENDLSKEDVRNVKKRKNNVPSANKVTKMRNSPMVILQRVDARQTASATTSSAQSLNENKENCEERRLICMDMPEPLNLASASVSPNLLIVPHHCICMQNKTLAKGNRKVSITNNAGKNMSELPTIMDNCKHHVKMRCVICMDTKTYVRNKSLNCGHNFHAFCLRTWFKCNDICPICMPYSSERNSLDVFQDEDICESHEQLPCSICLDTVDSSNFETLLCSHSFHVECVRKWFGVKEVCPVCMECYESDLPRDDFNDLRENMQCMICKNTEIFTDFEFLLCNHSFHAICLENWFQVSASCPICIPYDPESTTSVRFQGGDGNAEECVICIGTEDSVDLRKLSCGHNFHVTCIETWFQIKKSCPVCIPPDVLNQTINVSIRDELEELQCLICNGVEESLEFEVLSCDLKNSIWHNFHSKCIETWFQVNDSCPVCISDNCANIPPMIPEEEKNEVVICAICVDTEDYSDIEFLRCCHSFHSVCIQSWLKRKNKCPICNTVISVNGVSNRDLIDLTCA